MSTYYRSLSPISFDELFDGRLEKFGVYEHIVPGEASDTERCLTDGRNYLWAYASEDGSLDIRVAGFNAPGKILGAIAEAFDAEIVSEHEPRYWGFATEEEYKAWHEEIAQKHHQEFYEDVLRYVRGEPNDIRKGTVGERKAKIAKELISQTPELAKDKDRLLDEVDLIDDERHAVKVTLT